MRRPLAAALAAAFALSPLAVTADEAHYTKPPAAIEQLLTAPPIPLVALAPGRTWAAQMTPLRYPPVADLARPMLRIAGLRIDPATNGIHHAAAASSLAWIRVADGRRVDVALPARAHVQNLRYSADGARWIAYDATPAGTELWTGVVGSPHATRIAGAQANAIFAGTLAWLPDGVRAVVALVDRNGAPPHERVAAGPVVQETSGKAGEVWTYEDLLANSTDEANFTYYATSRLAIVDTRTGTVTRTGARGLFTDVTPSPDGTRLLTERVHTPYSYQVPWERFPTAIEVRDVTGAVQRTVADRPLDDHPPQDGVPTGPREVAWDGNAPHTLVWLEALDAGDPRANVTAHDRVVREGSEVLRAPQRIVALTAFAHDSRLLVRWYDRATRLTTTALADGAHPGAEPVVLWTLRDGERYRDPGQPLTEPARNGAPLVTHDGDRMWLRGQGAGPDGLRPFLDRYDVSTKTAARVFQSALAPLETVVAPLDPAARTLVLTRQSPSEPPNLVVRNVANGDERALTHIADPAPVVRTIGRRVVRYKRADGIDLSMTVYTPAGWDGKTPLPTLLWAYPLEFNDPSVASQTTNSAQTFQTISGISELFMALDGYAVLDNASIPIVGDPKIVNDTYIEQLTAGARAAIDEAVRIGVTDRNRVAAGGHSYGAFMTANLLAHTRLFKAGIARSGAYNRSLTPFGFQSERRTYWQAQDVYTKLSPFTYANEIKDPLLLIHGIADDNTGTFPIQSERFYAAIKGNGGTARLVMLPYEAHGYVGRESVETTLAEMVNWLDRYVKRQEVYRITTPSQSRQ